MVEFNVIGKVEERFENSFDSVRVSRSVTLIVDEC